MVITSMYLISSSSFCAQRFTSKVACLPMALPQSVLSPYLYSYVRHFVSGHQRRVSRLHAVCHASRAGAPPRAGAGEAATAVAAQVRTTAGPAPVCATSSASMSALAWRTILLTNPQNHTAKRKTAKVVTKLGFFKNSRGGRLHT
jgi:hypothetical protein